MDDKNRTSKLGMHRQEVIVLVAEHEMRSCLGNINIGDKWSKSVHQGDRMISRKLLNMISTVSFEISSSPLGLKILLD